MHRHLEQVQRFAPVRRRFRRRGPPRAASAAAAVAAAVAAAAGRVIAGYVTVRCVQGGAAAGDPGQRQPFGGLHAPRRAPRVAPRR